jgi:23S rRNA pseudouridine2605 synthase
LTLRLTHPSYYIEKTYAVRAKGSLSSHEQKLLESGIVIEGQKTAPAKISHVKLLGPATEFLMTIHEGRKRQIRLMLEALGHPVVSLQRISEGPLTLGDLRRGCWRRLTKEEIERLKN